MTSVSLRKLKSSDQRSFAQWWRDRVLIKLTSGVLEPISDREVKKYFREMLQSTDDYHFMIMVSKRTIGHLWLTKRRNAWYEIQIVIGEKEYWGKGYGTKAIQHAVRKMKRLGIIKIYLEVRPTNARAIRAYEKCGFQKVGIKKYSKNKYLPETLKMTLRD